MRRWLVSAAVFVAVAAAPLSAELKITQKMTVRQAPGAGTDMMSQMATQALMQMFGPDGVESTVITHEDGRVRTEYKGSFMGMPAGAVMVLRPDGTSFGFDAKAGTWWKMPDAGQLPPEAAAMMAQMKPDIKTSKTGKSETIAGLRADHMTISMVMPIPLPPELQQAPPEVLAMIPKEIRMDGDIWLAPQFTKYSKAAMKLLTQGPLAQMGLDKVVGGVDGFMVKQIFRMSMPAVEMETVTMSATEEDVPDSVFDLPAGLKEIPMPVPGIR